jgi:hypothetical protein
MTQKTQIERPLDYYKRRSRYLRRRYGRKLADSWIGGEIDTGDNVTLEEYEVMRRPGEFVVLYALFYNGRIVAMYDDAAVAWEVARVVHEVLRLVRLERRRKRRS